MSEPTREDRLIVDRDRLEEAIGEATPGQLPALVREHREVLAELAKLAKPTKGSVRDQLADKRAARKPTPRKSRASGTAPT